MSYIQTADSYGVENKGFYATLTSNTASYGQTFMGDGRVLHSAAMLIYRTGNPTGNAVISIYAHEGTYGVDGNPVGNPIEPAIAVSNSVDLASLGTSSTTTTPIRFYYSGYNRIVLEENTPYCLSISCPGASLDVSNNVQVNTDGTFLTHSGNALSNGSPSDTVDRIFYIYTKPLKNILPGNN